MIKLDASERTSRFHKMDCTPWLKQEVSNGRSIPQFGTDWKSALKTDRECDLLVQRLVFANSRLLDQTKLVWLVLSLQVARCEFVLGLP